MSDTRCIAYRASAASPGPWSAVLNTSEKKILILTGSGTAEESRVATVNDRDNAAFIAHARTDISALLTRIADLNDQLDAARRQAAAPDDRLTAAITRAQDAVDELLIEDELADGFRSRNGDLTLQDAVAAFATLIAASSPKTTA